MIIRLGRRPADLDRSSLSVDVADFLSYYGSQSLETLDLSGALNEMIDLIRRYHIILPVRIVMLLKLLVTLEGTGQALSPKFSLVEIMRPYRKKLLLRRFSPGAAAPQAPSAFLGVGAPAGHSAARHRRHHGADAGRQFDIHLDHRGLEPSVNRLVLGMLASALFLGSALMISRDVGVSTGCPGRGRRDVLQCAPRRAALAGDQQVGTPRPEEIVRRPPHGDRRLRRLDRRRGGQNARRRRVLGEDRRHTRLQVGQEPQQLVVAGLELENGLVLGPGESHWSGLRGCEFVVDVSLRPIGKLPCPDSPNEPDHSTQGQSAQGLTVASTTPAVAAKGHADLTKAGTIPGGCEVVRPGRSGPVMSDAASGR